MYAVHQKQDVCFVDVSLSAVLLHAVIGIEMLIHI
jgi:hypothetical protein